MDEDIKKENMGLVFIEELSPILEKFGLKEDFLAGKLYCSKCRTVVTEDNLSAFFWDEGIKLVCDKRSCVQDIKEQE